jgi:dephospho-CoA kinase
MYIVGLTGGIASGKSTVAAHWVSLGGFEIDADQLARQVVAPGTPGAADIRAKFGDDVFDTDDSLNRAKLGAIVFADATKRQALEAIVHPLVKAEAQAKVAAQPESSIIIYNVPLLVEASVDLPFDKVITVEAPVEKQIERLIQSRGLTKKEAEARIAAQATPAQRANAADTILNSNQSLELMLADATAIWNQIEREALTKHSA